ncbi:hypothetical protein [Actibacterium sp. 188UL27-1]|uniref:hypothetical protein n=1 Tax=Actibacterium sp. 188UL27-1 TaxID=2786961 RepID=UPI00195DF50B|nr:hypothetical protein [Actibacterium sp. 188UL27-1]MBM7067774.1 hypothetical protein [Actibacterium sp. 188UL27-1]
MSRFDPTAWPAKRVLGLDVERAAVSVTRIDRDFDADLEEGCLPLSRWHPERNDKEAEACS